MAKEVAYGRMRSCKAFEKAMGFPRTQCGIMIPPLPTGLILLPIQRLYVRYGVGGKGIYMTATKGTGGIQRNECHLGACRVTPYSYIIVARWCLCLHYGILARLLGGGHDKLFSWRLFPRSLEIDAIVPRCKESIALRNSLLVMTMTTHRDPMDKPW